MGDAGPRGPRGETGPAGNVDFILPMIADLRYDIDVLQRALFGTQPIPTMDLSSSSSSSSSSSHSDTNSPTNRQSFP